MSVTMTMNQTTKNQDQYGNLLLKCCGAAMDFIAANEGGNEKSARKHYDELRDVCEQIGKHEDEGESGDGE
jgi:hypothetical protein